MARAAGIGMSDCRLFEENDRARFMTRRACAYEQAFAVARALSLPPAPAPPT